MIASMKKVARMTQFAVYLLAALAKSETKYKSSLSEN